MTIGIFRLAVALGNGALRHHLRLALRRCLHPGVSIESALDCVFRRHGESLRVVLVGD